MRSSPGAERRISPHTAGPRRRCGSCSHRYPAPGFGRRGFVEADVTRERTRLTFLPCATASYIPLTVTVNAATTREKLALTLEDAIRAEHAKSTGNAGERRHYYLVTVQGERDIDTDFSVPVALPFPLARWEDRTAAAVDYDRLLAQHSGDLLGQFIAEMKRQPAGPLRDRALACGVRACLGEEVPR